MIESKGKAHLRDDIQSLLQRCHAGECNFADTDLTDLTPAQLSFHIHSLVGSTTNWTTLPTRHDDEIVREATLFRGATLYTAGESRTDDTLFGPRTFRSR